MNIIILNFLIYMLATGFHNHIGQLSPQEVDGPKASITPNVFRVYEKTSFTVSLSSEVPLSEKTLIEVQLPNSFNNDQVSPSKVKPWQTEDPDKPHYISVDCPQNPNLQVGLKIRKREYVGGYNAVTRHGVCLNILIENGIISPGQNIAVHYVNTTTPWLANQRPGSTDHEGMVYIAINGNPIENFPTYIVESGPESYRRVIVPSSVRPGQKFDVQLVSLDKYSNLTNARHDGVSLSCDDKVLASGISYVGKGKVSVMLPEKGVYRILAEGVLSNPIVVEDHPDGPYWGDIHFHNYPSVDAMGNTPYLYAREVSCLDFAGASEHGAGGLPKHWSQTRKWVRENNEPGKFVSILALESGMSFMEKGRPHINIYHYVDDAEALYGTDNGETDTEKDLLMEYIKDYKVIAQTHHSGWGFDMRMRYPDEMKLIEIYSMHGQSEYYNEDTQLSMGHQRHRQGGLKGPYYARDAWALGKRWYCVGSSDNHFGQPGVYYNSVLAVYADTLTRTSILDEIARGSCYATTGERIILDMKVNGHPMGSAIPLPADGGLKFQMDVHGTGIIESVELFGCPYIVGDSTVEIGRFMFEEGDQRVEKALTGWFTVYEKHGIGEMDFSSLAERKQGEDKMIYYIRVIQKEPITLPCELEGSGVIQKRPVEAWGTPVWVESK